MQDKPLLGLTILVTRPEKQAKNLRDTIVSLGGIPCLFPTLEIANPIDINKLHHIIEKINEFDVCIFTSQNAVSKSINIINKYWPKLPKSLQIAAIGAATAKLLNENRIKVNLCPQNDFSSESLLSLPELQNVQNKKILIVTGESGRKHLAKTLESRGAKIFHAISYRRQRPSSVHLPSPLEKIDIITSTSSESLSNLWEMLSPNQDKLQSLPLVVISPAMAQLATSLGFNQKIYITKQVSDQAIIDCLIEYNKKGKQHNGKEN